MCKIIKKSDFLFQKIYLIYFNLNLKIYLIIKIKVIIIKIIF